METTIDNKYELQGIEFAKKHGIKLTVLDSDFRPFFSDDKQSRSVYKLRLSRGKKSYTFNFGQSIVNTGIEPSIYDVLATIEKNDPESFEDFCDNYGYPRFKENSFVIRNKNSYKVYKAVCKEFEAVNRLFSDIIEELYEIQ
jgi:hypothetical protein